MKKFAFFFLTCLLLILFTATSFAQTTTVRTKVGNPKGMGTEAPPPPTNIKQGILDTFGITMNNFDNDHLFWAWQRLWEAGPGFTNKLNGTRIDATSENISSQEGCFGGATSLRMYQYQPEGFFKFILLHELAHIIQSCTPREISLQVEQMNAYDAEGGISYYAQNATRCISGVSNYNEDYADMLAYYIDKSAGYVSAPLSAGCNPGSLNPPNPYENFGYQKHSIVAEQILSN